MGTANSAGEVRKSIYSDAQYIAVAAITVVPFLSSRPLLSLLYH